MRDLASRLVGLALVGLLPGCGRSAPVGSTGPLASSTGASPALLASVSPAGSSERTPPMPGPERGRLAAAVAQNETCEVCHTRQAQQWRSSLHHQSGTHAAYQQAFAVEPKPFCQGCHVPEGRATEAPPSPVRALGVGCVTCHVTAQGEVLAAVAGEAREAPHAVVRSAAFSSGGGCASCHEFRFPERLVDDDDRAFMQTTVREHQRSVGRERSCVDCHMPTQDGHRAHDFSHVRDPAWLRDNLLVEVSREGDLLQLSLRQPRPGHGFPTGDLFRRLEVGVIARAPGGREVLRERQFLSRRFQLRPGHSGRYLDGDDRVFDEPGEVVFAVPEGTRVEWWVSLQRVATVGDGWDPAQARVESEVRLREGVVR